MRLKLTLVPKHRGCKIPINYQYPLSAAIYRILSSASPEYAEFLHWKGYLTEQGKPQKLFTFSYLSGMKFRNGVLNALPHQECTLFVSSPMIEDFIQNLVIGLFENQEIAIGNHLVTGRFQVAQVESEVTPNFLPETQFKCLSPFVVSTMKERDGRLQPHYLRPDDSELSEAVRQNLVRKFETVYQTPPTDTNLSLHFDETYVKKRGGYHKITKLITLKEHHETETTHIKGIFAPFILTGSTELMLVAWEAGLGSRCSQGFGCVGVL